MGPSAPTAKVRLFCEDRLVCIVANGRLSAEEIIETLDEHYGLIGTSHVLWDFTNADLSNITDEHFANIAAVAAIMLGPADGRKTAYVTSDSATYSQLCKYTTVAFKVGVPSEYSVFLDRYTAVDWLTRR